MKISITLREVRKPADAANRPDLPPPSRASDGAAQTAGTARSAVVAKHATPLRRLSKQAAANNRAMQPVMA